MRGGLSWSRNDLQRVFVLFKAESVRAMRLSVNTATRCRLVLILSTITMQ